MAECIAAIAGTLASLSVEPMLRHIKYPFVYKSNIQTFEVKMEELKERRNYVQSLVDAAKNNDENIREGVSAWLQKVDDLKKKADEDLKGVAGSDMWCLFNRCPNLKSRYLSSRRATKMTIEVDKLKEEGTLFERGTVSYPRQPVQELISTPHEEYETRLSIKKKIKEALMDKEISIIGICGMPGVGKTTLAKEIVNEVRVDKLFEEVAFAVVSEAPDINKIQDELAEMLGRKIEEKVSKDVRAGQLRRRLERNNGKSVLVILDDVWKDIDLGTIGIPSPRDREGLKIMFTTRNENNCSKMEAQKQFKIEVLSREEGWQLFKDMAGISDDGTDVELVPIAQEVAKECGGLPLALVVVGKALKSKKDEVIWRDALQQLKKSSVTNLEGILDLYSRIELSYNSLKSNEDRDLLLLCSLFAEDESIPIEDLVTYARGLGLFPNTEKLNETRYRAYSIAYHLKSCYLLQPGWNEDEVKLHDVIRDFCLQKGRYLVKHAGLKEWPELDESCSAVSITFDKMDQLRGGLNYQNVKLLRVISRHLGAHNISEEFFQDMKELRVVELKGMYDYSYVDYVQIPSSIQFLTGLRALCFISCRIDSESLSMIGSLKKLEILSFYDSYIGDYVPIKVANLSNLKSLDLRVRKTLRLRPGVLSGMKKLEELYFGDYISIKDEDQRYIIEELRSLTSLRAFQISHHDVQILKQILRALSLENLENFEIKRIDRPESGTERERITTHRRVTRGLYLYGNDEENLPSCLQPEIKSLMKRTYRLLIKEDKVLKNVVSELDGDGFINLKTLDVSDCDDFKYLIDAANSIPSGTFGKLDCLTLERLPKLTEICNGNLPRGVVKPPLFCNLVKFYMFRCGAIRSLFRESVAKCLVNLGILHISNCPMLEEVVSTEGEEVTKTCKMLEFPKLTTVTLWDLSRFKSFTSQSNSGVVCQTLQVTFPNMNYLHVEGLDCIVKLFGKEMPITSLHKQTTINVWRCVTLLTVAESDSIQLIQNLDYLHVSTCNALEVLFDFEGIKVSNDAEINILGRLKELSMISLPELVHITRMVPKGFCVFQNLTTLRVRDCKSLRYIFSSSVVNSLAALESLSIKSCDALEEIIGRKEEEEEENTSETRNILVTKPPLNLHHFRQAVSMDAKQNEVIDMLEFPKLIRLDLFYLISFKSFRSVTNNDSLLRTLFNGQVTLPNLEYLSIERFQYLEKLASVMVENSSKSLQNLEQLQVLHCEALEVLFDFECQTVTNDHDETVLGRLRTLHLKSLAKLVHITRMIPEGIRVFEKLTSLAVERCSSLKYLLSPSMANSLVALEILKVSDCESIEEIVEKEEEGTSESKIVEGMKIVFPNLNDLLLENLPRIQMFCSQNYELVFPSMKRFTVENCPMMSSLHQFTPFFPNLNHLKLCYLSSFKSFRSESNNDGDLQMSFNQVTLSNLEYLGIKGLQYIVKLVSITRIENSSIPLQNLTKLEVEDCEALEVLFDFECVMVINDHAETVLGRLESLQLKSLAKLVHITRMIPEGIRVFEKLTSLAVERCGSLKYLLSPSMANSLVGLEILKVSDCESIEEIVGGEEEEEEVTSYTKTIEGMKIRIAFTNLRCLILKNLPRIQMLCSQNNELVFPSMKRFTVENCPMMSSLHQFTPFFPNLNHLKLCYLSSFKSFRSESNNDGDLQMSFNQVTLSNLEYLGIKGLQYIVKLVSLTRIENSSIPLQNLTKLEVEDCEALKVLFDFECVTVTNDHAETVLGRLKSLQLKSLAKLVHITRMIPEGIRFFEKLTLLVVERCGSLKYLLSPSMANSLVALEILKVSDCELIEEIVGGEDEEEGTSETKTVEGMKISILFPNLSHLMLINLPRIQMLCCQNHELVFPPAKLIIANCPMMKKSNEEGSILA